MKILVASDSYKGCMTSKTANAQIAAGLTLSLPSAQIEQFPISDGGEGMAEAFASACHGKLYMAQTRDLYGMPIEVRWAYDPSTNTACIDAASCLGLTLYPKEQRRPMEASSYGLGVLIAEILRTSPERLIIGLGGTGTNDGGMGILAALGCRFFDASRRSLAAKAGNLHKIAFISKSHFRLPRQTQIIAACDVDNPLLGSHGATWFFGKQKGLSAQEQKRLEDAMAHYEAKLNQTFHVSTANMASAGAAGGIGAVLIGVMRAKARSGVSLLAEYGHLEEKIASSQLIFTGEGQTDAQTLHGKVVDVLCEMGKKANIPVICLSGALGIGYEGLYERGAAGIFSTADRAMSFKTALESGPTKLLKLSYNIGMLLSRIMPAARNDEAKSKSE